MSDDKDRDIPNFIVQTIAANSGLDVTLGCNWITGSPMVGDRIRLADGRYFVVTQRVWLAGADRKANMAIRISEEPTPLPPPSAADPATGG